MPAGSRPDLAIDFEVHDFVQSSDFDPKVFGWNWRRPAASEAAPHGFWTCCRLRSKSQSRPRLTEPVRLKSIQRNLALKKAFNGSFAISVHVS